MDKKIFEMEEFEIAVMNGIATWWQMNLPSGVVTFGEAKAKMLGYPDSAFSHYQDFVNLVHPDDRDKIMQAMRDHLDGRTPLYETTYRIKHKNGEYVHFYDCGQIVKKEGDEMRVIGFVLRVQDDVTALEQMKNFKSLLMSGKPSIIELVSKIRS